MRPPPRPPVSSFGGPRPVQVDEDYGPVLMPPVVMPPVQVPVVLYLDVESLTVVSGQITEMVTRAVRDGFREAIAEVEADHPNPDDKHGE